MKRSDFVTELSGLGRHNAEVAAQLADRAGTPWDPEEPELPEKVRWNLRLGLAILLPNGDLRQLRPEEFREAAARWNAWGELLELLDRMKWGAINVEEVARQVKAHLESERERLK